MKPIAREYAGTVIGPYKLLERIGEGAVAAVFRAEQTEPVRRNVALKILKPGIDSPQIIARFEAERQALALMDHCNIVKILDGGATGSGHPYYVMELIKGVPITDFCEQNDLTLHERLGLFIQLCHAVQHTHQKCIIHRDLKPSDILVTLHAAPTSPQKTGGAGVVKLIDFGVAKAAGQQLTDRTLVTGFGNIVGTLEYMSPELAAGNRDVDIRTDIYSLGALLYELLTGTTPFTKERFQGATEEKIGRVICDEAAPKPSMRLCQLKDSLSISAARGKKAAKWTKRVSGELDCIAMKCLEKNPSRRYETVESLARDIEHWLNDEPVEACPPSARQRVLKFIRRNRRVLAIVTVVAVAALVAAIVLGLTTRDW